MLPLPVRADWISASTHACASGGPSVMVTIRLSFAMMALSEVIVSSSTRRREPRNETVVFMTVSQGDGARWTVLVVDDHPVVRRGMVALLAAEPWVRRTIEAGTLADARRLLTTEKPELVVVDLTLPDGDGTELIREMKTIAPACAAVVVTMSNDAGAVDAALRAGAQGYVLKDAAPELLVGALRTVADGGRILGPRVNGGMFERRPAGPIDHLTARERQVLTLLAQGNSNSEIARTLSLSEKTVRNQVSIIIVKLGVSDRVQAALLAHRSDLIG
jgi:DNA-binding NarL/FixJ family response regulator